MEQREGINTEPGSAEGLAGRELVEWALAAGEERCVEELGHGSIPRRYLETVARRVGVTFSPGLFECSVEDLMDRR